jgi:hypothetical protein
MSTALKDAGHFFAERLITWTPAQVSHYFFRLDAASFEIKGMIAVP